VEGRRGETDDPATKQEVSMKTVHNERARSVGWSGLAGVGLATWLAAGVALADPPTSGLQAWYKADTGVTTDGSGNVSQWNDQSGNNKHATQSTAGNQPLLSSTLMPIGSNMPVIAYGSAGGYDQLNLPNVSQDSGTGSTVYLVVNDDADGSGNTKNWLNRVAAAAPAIYGRASSSTKVGLYYST
jgi:hypothetical protein